MTAAGIVPESRSSYLRTERPEGLKGRGMPERNEPADLTGTRAPECEGYAETT